jgi:hypothetical protein
MEMSAECTRARQEGGGCAMRVLNHVVTAAGFAYAGPGE